MEQQVEQSAPGILRFQVRRGITNTYKEALNILEELQREHEAALSRLEEALPEQDRRVVKAADYWHRGKFEALRKRILTSGNNSIRAIDEQITNLDIRFK